MTARTPADDRTKDDLLTRFPDFDIWYVRPVYGVTSWSAKHKGAAVAEKITDYEGIVEWLRGQS
jgi:hypothetical protein